MRIKMEDVLAFIINGQHVCPECITDEELEKVKLEDIITEETVMDSNDLLFCDRDDKRIH